MGSVIMTVTETNEMIKVDTQRGIRSSQQVISRCGYQLRPQYNTATSIMGAYQQKNFGTFKGSQQISKISHAQAQCSFGLFIDNQKCMIKKEEISDNSSQCDELQHEHRTNEVETSNLNQGLNKVILRQNMKIQEKSITKGFLKDKISLVLNIIQEDDQQSKPINFQMQKLQNCIQIQEVKVSESFNSKSKYQTQKYSHVLQQIQKQNYNITLPLEESDIIADKQQQQLSEIPDCSTHNLKQTEKQNTLVNKTTQHLITQGTIFNKSLIKRQSHLRSEQSAKFSKKMVKGNRTNNNISIVYSDTIEQKTNNKTVDNITLTAQNKNKVINQGSQKSSVDIEEYQNKIKAEKIKSQETKRKKDQKKIAQQKRKISQLKKIQQFRKKIKEEENKKIEIESKQLRKIYQI